MNLDKLKSAWNNENTDDVHIPSQIKQLRQAKHPLDKLKQNMNKEWYIQIVTILFLGFFPQLFPIHPSLHVIYYASYTLLVVISAYYLNLFRLFYNRINHYTADTKDSLTEIYYDFKLNIERYHAFGFLLLPTALIVITLYAYNILLEKGKDFSSLSSEFRLTLIVLTLVVSLSFILSILAWTRYYYGPYVNQLKKVLDELKAEELKLEQEIKNGLKEEDLKTGE